MKFFAVVVPAQKEEKQWIISTGRYANIETHETIAEQKPLQMKYQLNIAAEEREKE